MFLKKKITHSQWTVGKFANDQESGENADVYSCWERFSLIGDSTG